MADDREDKAASEPSASAPDDPAPFVKAKKQMVLSCAAIAGGLAIAGSVDRGVGGVVLLAGWLGAVAALHRLGRAGSERRA